METKTDKIFFKAENMAEEVEDKVFAATLKKEMCMKFFKIMKQPCKQVELSINHDSRMQAYFHIEKCPHLVVFAETTTND